MDAILDLMPLDYFVESPAGHMAPQEGAAMPPAGEEVIEAAAMVVTKHADGVSLAPIDRFDCDHRVGQGRCRRGVIGKLFL